MNSKTISVTEKESVVKLYQSQKRNQQLNYISHIKGTNRKTISVTEKESKVKLYQSQKRNQL